MVKLLAFILVTDGELKPVIENGIVTGYTARRTITRRSVPEGSAPALTYSNIYAHRIEVDAANIPQQPTTIPDGSSQQLQLPILAKEAAVINKANLAKWFADGDDIVSFTIDWNIPVVQDKNCYDYRIVDGDFVYDAAKKQYTATRTISRIFAGIVTANAPCPAAKISYENIAKSANLQLGQSPERINPKSGIATKAPNGAKQRGDFDIAKLASRSYDKDGNSKPIKLVWIVENSAPTPTPLAPVDRIPAIDISLSKDKNAPVGRTKETAAQVRDFVEWLRNNPTQGIELHLTALGDVKTEEGHAWVLGATLDDIVLDSKNGLTYRMRIEAVINMMRADIAAEAARQGVPIHNDRIKFIILELKETPVYYYFDWKR